VKYPGVGLPKDLKHCSEVIRGVHIQCDGIELEFVKEPAVAAGRRPRPIVEAQNR
jgi:hypothetical protein